MCSMMPRRPSCSYASSEPSAPTPSPMRCATSSPSARACRWRSGSREPGWHIRSLANRLPDQRRRIDEFIAGDLAVRACFQVSFDALARGKSGGGADPASLFRMLGVWQGPSIGLHGAAALAGQPEALVGDSLEVLVDAHLLESPAPDRYRLHDLLRDYAAERAEADEPAQAAAGGGARRV